MTDDDYFPISALNDLSFCKRGCAMHRIEQVWVDNVHSVEKRMPTAAPIIKTNTASRTSIARTPNTAAAHDFSIGARGPTVTVFTVTTAAIGAGDFNYVGYAFCSSPRHGCVDALLAGSSRWQYEHFAQT